MQQAPFSETERRNGTSGNGTNGLNGHHAPPPQLLESAGSPPPTEDEGSLDLAAIWSAFRRRWFLALSLGLILGIPAAMAAWTFAPAPYVAFAEIHLNSIAQGFPGSNRNNSPVPDFDIYKQTVLKRASYPSVLNQALGQPEVRTANIVREQEPHADVWLEENLSVRSAGTEYVRIELEGEHPKELADIVNAVAKALIVNVNNELHRDRDTREKHLQSLINKEKDVIETRRAKLEDLRDALKVDPAEIERRQRYLLDLTNSLRSALVEIELQRLKLKAQPQAMADDGKLPQNQIESWIEKIAMGDPRYQRAKEDISTTKIRIKQQERLIEKQSKTLDETHPRLVEAEKKLAKFREDLKEFENQETSVREEIKKEVMANLPEGAEKATSPQDWLKNHEQVFEEAFKENEEKLEAELEEIKTEQKDLEDFSYEGSQIKDEIDRAEEKLAGYLNEAEKLRFELNNSPTLIEQSREAEVPHQRSMKKKTMLSGVAGCGVFGFIVAGIVFMEFRTQRIANMNQVSEKLNLRVMGAVPLLPKSATNGNTVKKRAKNAIWYSALTEAVDTTRTLLIRGSQVESLKTVMLASALGGEGKTTMASHLATSLARGGRKILLVDCDLRRPCMHRAFDVPNGDGVCEVLRGEAQVADCIHDLESPAGLSLLPAGKLDQQVLKLLAMDALGDLLEPLKKQYDFIIVDSSPLLPVTDGFLVAQHVDGVILSIRRDVSRIGKVVMTCQKLSMLGIPLLGAVTIGLQEETTYQSRYGYNYYGYGRRQHYYTQPPPA